jgi:hypothetical protein
LTHALLKEKDPAATDFAYIAGGSSPVEVAHRAKQVRLAFRSRSNRLRQRAGVHSDVFAGCSVSKIGRHPEPGAQVTVSIEHVGSLHDYLGETT